MPSVRKPLRRDASPDDPRGTQAPAADVPLWTSSFLLVMVIVHTFFLSNFLLTAALPLYVAKSPRWQVGLVVGVPFIASLILRPFTGRLVDRSGRRVYLITGAAGCAAMMALHGVSANIWFLAGVRLLLGAAWAFITTAIMASLADVLPPTRRGAGMGWYGIFYTSTNLYGPALGLWLASSFGYAFMFGFDAALNVAALLVALALTETGVRTIKGTPPARLFSRSALLPMSTFLSITIPAGAVTAFLALVEKQRHGGDPGLFFLLFGVTLMSGRVFGGWVSDRFSRTAAIVPGLVLTGVAMLGLAAAGAPVAFYLVALMYGFGFALGHTGSTILTMDRAPEAERGAAMATLTVAWDIGTLVGAFMLGFLVDAAGYGAVFLLVGLIPIAQAGIYMMIAKPRRGVVAPS